MKIEKDKTLQEARTAWVFTKISEMKLANPVTELSKKMRVGKSLVSEVLNKKAAMSLNFVRTFCTAYEIDFDAINHSIIESIKEKIINVPEDGKNHTKGNIIPLNYNPELNLSDTDFMRNFMEFMREEQRQRSEDQRQRGLLIEQQGFLIEKIPDAERESVVRKKASGM